MPWLRPMPSQRRMVWSATTPVFSSFCALPTAYLLFSATPGAMLLAWLMPGWKGTVANMAGVAVGAMRRLFGSDPADLVAGIGPAIGPCHYIVQDDVGEQVRRGLPFWSDVMLQAESGLRLDLPEANRRQLLESGLRPERIEMAGICTACRHSEFYSHRAEKGKTGRFGVLVAWSGDDA